jgi:hypothetical protein
MIAVRVTRDGFARKMKRVREQVRNPRAMMAAVGREGANQLRGHFRKKDREEPNRLQGKREHFWLRVMRSTQAPVVDGAGRKVTISITHPAYAQKLFGGVIRAKRVRNLSIPQTAEAYGRAPAVFERETGLKLIFIRSTGVAFLATRRSLSLVLQIEYVLKPSVDQQADPRAFPDQDKFEEALLARADKVLQRELTGPTPGGQN